MPSRRAGPVNTIATVTTPSSPKLAASTQGLRYTVVLQLRLLPGFLFGIERTRLQG
jgi:hypothetical protein